MPSINSPELIPLPFGVALILLNKIAEKAFHRDIREWQKTIHGEVPHPKTTWSALALNGAVIEFEIIRYAGYRWV